MVGTALREDVVALHGSGRHVPPAGDGQAMMYVDAARTVVMTVEDGTDSTVTRVTVRRIEPAPSTPSAMLDVPVSQRIRPGEGFGPWGQIRLGDPDSVIRSLWGEPSEQESVHGIETWWFETDYAPTECYATARVGLMVHDHVLVAAILDSGP